MKETFTSAELGSRVSAGDSLGRRRSSAFSHDDLRRVVRLRDEARLYGLLGVDVLDSMTEEQMAAAYNGIGPASFPPSIRQAIDGLLPTLRCVALIHDVRWAYSDGSKEQFKASNDEFAKNGAAVARAIYRWHPLRRTRLKSIAKVFANLCSSSAGWSAYLAVCR